MSVQVAFAQLDCPAAWPKSRTGCRGLDDGGNLQFAYSGSNEGQLVGIFSETVEGGSSGLALKIDDGYPTVSYVVPGSPADQEDVIAGSVVIGVGEGLSDPIKSVKGLSLKQIKELIRGPVGSYVRLEIVGDVRSRRGKDTFVLQRKRVNPTSLFKARTVDKGDSWSNILIYHLGSPEIMFNDVLSHPQPSKEPIEFEHTAFCQTSHQDGRCVGLKRSSSSLYYGDLEYSGGTSSTRGFGIEINDAGNIYIGKFDGQRSKNGDIHVINLDGEEYRGRIQRSKKNGFGKYYYSSGNIYSGEWKNGLQHGAATVFFRDGKPRKGRVFKGVYFEGKRQAGDWFLSDSDYELTVRIKSEQLLAAVRALQMILIDWGYLDGFADGLAGPQTKMAFAKAKLEMPEKHQKSMSRVSWFNSEEIISVSAELLKYTATSVGECPSNNQVYSLCFN